MFQALCLHLHSATILFDELSEDEFQQLGNEWNPPKEVPGGHYVDPALISGDWRDRGQTGEPVLPGADGFGTNVGENEIDCGADGIGVSIQTKKLVGRGV